MTFMQFSFFILLTLYRSGIAGTIQWIRTAQGTQDRLSPQANLTFSKDFLSNVTVTIDRSMTYQTIIGFGGAFTDSSSYVFSKLNSTHQSTILDMYFSDRGLRYNMARLPIGSCDFSVTHYTYDDTAGDTNLSHFTIDHDKTQIIPFIQEAMATLKKWSNDSLNIVASPWSPPAWMKKLNDAYCPLYCVDCTLKDEYQQTWADYFSKFISAYQDIGISIWGVTVQNEPGTCPLVYEGMHFTAETERDYIRDYLGPTLKRDHPDIKLLMYDHNKDHIVKWSNTVYSDKVTSQFVWGTAVHWYSGDDFDNLESAHILYPDKPILATEATVAREKDPENPTWSYGEHYAHDIIGDMNNWVVGFIDWNLLLDRYGGPNHAGPGECQDLIKCGSDAMILADLDKQILYPQIFYYYVGHISKYTPRGSLRIYNKAFGNSLECTAFLTPDKQVVVVVMNTSDQPITFKLIDTVNSGNIQAVKITALAHSIQTFIYS